jgi:PPOX class probable F420-dependent enzyme
MKIPQSVREMIESGTPAHLVTLNRDGSPQMTVVWITLDGDEIISAHLKANQKVKNILRDGRVAISMQSSEKNGMGLSQYVVLYGDAHIEEGGAPELLQKLAWIYIGPGVKFPQMENPPSGFITHIKVDRITGVGPWMEEKD